MLNSPYDAAAEREGFRALASSEGIGAYQGSVGAARGAWAREHRKALVGFIRAYVAGTRWLFDSAHREEAIDLLVKSQRGITRADAERSYAELVDPDSGSLSRDAALDLAGIDTVLALRRRFESGAATLGDASRYYDLEYRREALSTPASGR